jgi:type IV pilus assembly protein PilM
MIPWIPLSAVTQPQTSPVDDDVKQGRPPFGFSDVRGHAMPATDEAMAAPRTQIGFAAPQPVVQDVPVEPVFRTELSFRRNARPQTFVRAEAAGEQPPSVEPAVGHAETDELWEPETAHTAEVESETRTPFYKKEIGFFRRQPKDEVEDAPAPEPSHEETPEPALEEPVAEAIEIFDIDEPTEVDETPAPVEIEAAAETGGDELWDDGPDAAPGDERDDGVDVNHADETTVVTAAAEPGTKSKRSLRSRPGGPTPKRKSAGRGGSGGRRVVGLKIGASQIAAAVVQQVDGRQELHGLARVPLEEGIVVDGDVKDKAALAHALKAFFNDADLPRKDIRIGLPSNRIGVRTFDIVGVDDEERFDNAVRFKAHEVLPVAVNESLLDYRVIDERASENGEPLRRVLLAVAPRDQVEPYLDACNEAGVRVAGVDLEALGLLRAFVEPRPFAARTTDDTATVVASIGHESSTLLVSGGGTCEFTRVFDWGGGTLQDAIAQELEVHAAEAATILRHLALSGASRPLASLDDEARARALDAVRSRLTPFARELVSSLQFYQTQPDSLGIGEIVITGGTSHLIGLADSLHQMIGVNVRVGDPLQRVVVKTGIDPAVEATIGSLAVPIGLAIEDDDLRGVNLLPGELRETTGKRPNLLRVALPVAAAIPIVALGVMFLQSSGTVDDRQSQLDAVEAEISALPKPKRPIIDAGVAATEANRAVALAAVLGGRVPWDGVLRDVSLVLPSNVSLTKLSAELPEPTVVPAGTSTTTSTTTPAPVVPAQPTGVTVEGYTVDQPSVARLLARLRTVPSLTNIQLSSSERTAVGQKTIVKFEIIADIKQPGGAQ